ncbi:MAG TPA: hypothetical protein PK950_00920 [Candidatus Paceibacterota bacterium]|nr:hypothetical protein [Candidatus Paceibacterota bacterium]
MSYKNAPDTLAENSREEFISLLRKKIERNRETIEQNKETIKRNTKVIVKNYRQMIRIDLMIMFAEANLVAYLPYTIFGKYFPPNLQQIISPDNRGLYYPFLFLFICSLLIAFVLWHMHFKKRYRVKQREIEKMKV